jgi:hypothetical protein
MLSGRRDRSVALAALATLGGLGGLGGLGALCACGDGGGKPADASPDTPIDMAPGSCGDVAFAGEIIDWDATNTAFCGVFNATLTVRGQATQTDQTNPNGRFGLCIAHQAETLVDVAYSGDASQCSTAPGIYIGSAVLVGEQAVIDAGGLFSARAMTAARRATMFAAIGQPYNAGQGQLVVHVAGTPRAVSLSTLNHSAAQQFNGTSWEPVAGAAAPGSDVLFPNIDVSGGAVTVGVAGGAVGTTAVTLEPGVFTYLTVIAN